MSFGDTAGIIKERHGFIFTSFTAHLHRKCLWHNKPLQSESQKDSFIKEVAKIHSIMATILLVGGFLCLIGCTVGVLVAYPHVLKSDLLRVMSPAAKISMFTFSAVGFGAWILTLVCFRNFRTQLHQSHVFFTPSNKKI